MPRLRVELSPPHSAQRRMILEAKRFNVACMGRRFGKTLLGIDRVIETALRDAKPVAWFAPTYKLLEEVYRDLRRLLTEVIVRQDSQQHRLELVTGGAIECWTLDTPDAGRGRKYALAIIDEAAMVRRLDEAWTASIRPTLADLKGKAWFLSTPKGGNYFKTLYDRAGSDSDWARWQMPTHSNPYIHTDEVNAMQQELPSLVFQQEVLAQFIDMQGAVVKRDWLHYGTPKETLPVVLGVDLAISTKQDADYTACVALCRDLLGTVYVLDAQRIRAPFHQVLQFIQQMAAKWNPSIVAIEQVQYQAAVVQELNRTTSLPIRGITPDKDKLTRFLPLVARYEQGLITHARGLPAWFEEELLTFPVGEHDDLADALSLAFQSLPQAQPSTMTFKVNAL